MVIEAGISLGSVFFSGAVIPPKQVNEDVYKRQAHVSADQAVHGAGGFHVRFRLGDGAELVLGHAGKSSRRG